MPKIPSRSRRFSTRHSPSSSTSTSPSTPRTMFGRCRCAGGSATRASTAQSREVSSMQTPDRFVLTRAGIVNLYEYDDQVFEFADGRLLLRGHNTSGKTKALELLLPYCLDGDINPRKLDPFGAGYKDMKWNLTGCTGDIKRLGYAWLEFERIGPDGSAQRLTVGVGLRHNRD